MFEAYNAEYSRRKKLGLTANTDKAHEATQKDWARFNQHLHTYGLDVTERLSGTPPHPSVWSINKAEGTVSLDPYIPPKGKPHAPDWLEQAIDKPQEPFGMRADPRSADAAWLGLTKASLDWEANMQLRQDMADRTIAGEPPRTAAEFHDRLVSD